MYFTQTLLTGQGVSVLELCAVAVVRHVERNDAALPDESGLVRVCVAAQLRLHPLHRDPTQRLRTLVPDHCALFRVPQPRQQLLLGTRRPNLTRTQDIV